MSRNLDPKCKICRRLGESVCSRGPKCALRRRQYPPGIHGPKGYPRLTGFGQQLKEKQKARILYGLTERQFASYFKKSIGTKGNTGKTLLSLLERRLDNVLFRLHLATSRRQARQLVNHGHVLVNNRRVDIPSYLVKPGDVISFKSNVRDIPFVSLNLKQTLEAPEWITWDAERMSANIVNIPDVDEASLGINAKMIVEYYSR